MPVDFKGSRSKVKKAKAIRKALNIHKANLGLVSLGFSHEKILEIVQHLCTVGVFESEDRADAEFADPCPVQQDPVPKLETPKASSSEPVRSPSTVSDASQENTQAVKGGKSAPPGSATDNHGFTQATAG